MVSLGADVLAGVILIYALRGVFISSKQLDEAEQIVFQWRRGDYKEYTMHAVTAAYDAERSVAGASRRLGKSFVLGIIALLLIAISAFFT